MPRLPRIILPNVPHHITQRGNRRQTTFFIQDDYVFYLRNLEQLSETYNVQVVAYCLMPNHVHLLLVPPNQKSLITVVKNLHEQYSRYLNDRLGWKGCLWQGRFFSVPMSDQHFEKCIKYIEENPVRAGLVMNAFDYKWVSQNSSNRNLNNFR
ncbi:MAG: transposase [Proteobacteria bacterium]|nr:transposase [Pseudomonadota bacterium]